MNTTDNKTNAMGLFDAIDSMTNKLNPCKDSSDEAIGSCNTFDRTASVNFTPYAKGKKVVDVVAFMSKATRIDFVSISHGDAFHINCHPEGFSSLSILNDFEIAGCMINPYVNSLEIFICKKSPVKAEPKKKSAKK